MKLTYYAQKPNFGDALNAYMWTKILPANFLDDNESELFLGIGSILWDDLPAKARKIVVGSGYGAYTAPPNVHDGSWDIVFVRGPRTAALLGLDPAKSIGDGALLLRMIDLPAPAARVKTAFMPHFESIERGRWREVCAIAGVHFIDPTDPVESVLSQIMGAEMLITEAMHGAIVADALRTPWIAVQPIQREHRMKWLDWTDSLDLAYGPKRLFPSTAKEAWSVTSGRKGEGVMRRVLNTPVFHPVDLSLQYFAARNLQQLSRSEPVLSSDSSIRSVTERANSALTEFVERSTRLDRGV